MSKNQFHTTVNMQSHCTMYEVNLLVKIVSIANNFLTISCTRMVILTCEEIPKQKHMNTICMYAYMAGWYQECKLYFISEH